MTLAATIAALSLLAAAPAPAPSPAPKPAPAAPATAAAPPDAFTRACDAEAGKRKGRARRAFVTKCVADRRAALAAERRAAGARCNALASERDLKGRERTLFVSECVRKR